MATIIDGKAISLAIREEVKKEVAKLKKETGVQAGLAVILVGDDPGSQVYVRNKKIACEGCGILSLEYKLPAETTQEELIALVKKLNKNPKVHGILCQLPIPKGLDENEVLITIDPAKDVDGFHPANVGKFITLKKYSDIESMGLFLPCTPYGVMELLDRAGVNLDGADAVVIGRSNLVGKPVAMLLMSKNATVTICHSRTKDLEKVCKKADVLIAAIGVPNFVKGDWVKKGAAVIDVGINRTESGLAGDVDFKAAEKKAAFITPVPGGVGPMTIAMLMKNTLMAARNAAKANAAKTKTDKEYAKTDKEYAKKK